MTGNHVKPSSSRTTRRFPERSAVPEGGARSLHWRWVRDCPFVLVFSILPFSVQSQTVPSGQSLTLTEVLQDRVGDEEWLRLRFVAPQIAREGGTVGYEAVEDDVFYLCEHVARPYLVQYSLEPDVVVISLMDRPVEFGASDPEATQFFEAFRIQDDACVLEAY